MRIPDECCFCHRLVSSVSGYVDIGGLPLCVPCYAFRSTRTEMPCHVCGEPVRVLGDPLQTDAVCWNCESAADLPAAYDRARNKEPCDRCKGVTEYHHSSVYGQNLCMSCFEVAGRPCTQLYRGDRGYPAFVRSKPSLPAKVLPDGGGIPCVVCGVGLQDLLPTFELPVICVACKGPKWWAEMDRFREVES